MAMTLLQALLKNESGGRNIPNVHQGTSSGQAQGFFQITEGTWNDFGGRQYASSPLEATYEQQAAIAAKIPLKRWDESTVALMRATGRKIDPNLTLGENLRMNGEDFAAGSPAGKGTYDPRRDSPSYARPKGEDVDKYATEHPVGPEGDVVTTSPYALPGMRGTPDNPIVTKELSNPYEKFGAAVGKLGARDEASMAANMQTPPNPPLTTLPAQGTIDPAAAQRQALMMQIAMQRLNSGQLWPMSGGGGQFG